MFHSEKLEKRRCAMDLIRVTAVLGVISIHFLLHSGFYGQPVAGKRMLVMCVMRTVLSCCVPLFLVLSGWLLSGKKLEKGYYFGLSGTLAAYVLAGIACMVFNAAVLRHPYTAAKAFFDLLDFTAADYAWYVEMYIGLFLLVPFLNLLYHGLDTRRKKQALLLTMIALTVLPTAANAFNLENPAWWAAPAAVGGETRLLPRWWIGFYPVTYYFTGCYLREYRLRLKSRTIVLLLALSALAFGGFNFWQSYGVGFVTGPWVDWGGVQPYVMTVLVFSLLSRVRDERVPVPARYVLWGASELSLSVYLTSYIFDTAFYPRLNAAVPYMTDRLNWFPVMVGSVYACSLLLSLALYGVRALLGRLFIRAARAAHTAARQDRTLAERNRIRAGQIAFALCFGAAIVFALWKCPYGFGSTDDAFYLTVPHRLAMGDVLFADEWHVSQMSGLITLPLVWLYRTAVGSMDGVLLVSRYVYVVFHALVSILFYTRIRRHGIAAKAAALSYFLFTPYDIMAMSYNTMAMDFILLSGVLLATGERRWQLAASGICLAAGVLCCPYFAAAYFLYAAGVGLCALWRKGRPVQRDAAKRESAEKEVAERESAKKESAEKEAAESVFAPRRLLWLTVGVAAVSAVFAVYILSTCGLGGLLTSLPNIFSDPEHPAVNPLSRLQRTWGTIVNCHPQFKLVLYGYAVLLAAMLADRERKNHRAFYLAASCAATLVSLALFYPGATDNYYNAIMVPLIFVGFTSYLLCRDKPRALFVCVFAAGILYTMAVTIGSNQFFYAVGMASAVTNAASFLFLGQLLREMKERPDEVAYGGWLRRGAAGAAAVTVCVLLLMQIQVKAEHCFVDDSPAEMDYQLQAGPGRGIWTAEYKGTIYEDLNADLQYYKDLPPGKLLILCERTWCYLTTDPMEYATFSAWISGENEAALRRLETYYQINPDKVPDYIYLPKKNKFENPEAIVAAAQAKGYTLSEGESSWRLERRRI